MQLKTALPGNVICLHIALKTHLFRIFKEANKIMAQIENLSSANLSILLMDINQIYGYYAHTGLLRVVNNFDARRIYRC